jgi:hypothetical protein
MLRSLPFVLKIQQRLIEDMAKATHNAGWSRLHLKLDPGERRETEKARPEGSAKKMNGRHSFYFSRSKRNPKL